MKTLINAAMKREKCDLVIKGAKVFNVFTGETEEGEIAVKKGKIVGIGKGYEAERAYNANGAYALPSFIDAHIHVESSMLSPEEFAALSVRHGTGVIIADPHEIVNVCGIAGAEYMKEAFSHIEIEGVNPLEVCLQLPSCVPASPFETSGAVLDGRETEWEVERDLFYGLGEFMNYPAVIGADREALQKIEAAVESNKIIDGHAPALSGDALNAYASAGIKTDHECVNAQDCLEKLKKGLYVQLRNGSSAHNIEENAKAMNAYNYRRFILCSDDRNAYDLKNHGEIDDALRRLVKTGVPAPWAIASATLNTAECYGLRNKGAIAPSYDADIALVEDLKEFRVLATFKRGVLVSEGEKALFSAERYISEEVKSTVKIKEVNADDFKLDLSGKARVMRVKPNGIMTEEEILEVESKSGDVVLPQGVCKLAVIERHFASGNMGKCLLSGYGLKDGALGISVAHDSHNLVIVGDDNKAMARVAELLERAGGGMAIVNGKFEKSFALDIAGLMSSAPYEEVIRKTEEITAHARGMGVEEGIEPFMSLVFLPLAVIPKLRLTDKGLVDVDKFEFVSSQIKE
ncbi:MAG: adenine deaminase [Clostridia bacterium]|nr:adenine deaminase [Clostridia bacterium]